MIFLETWFKPLLFVHFILTVVLIGSNAHLIATLFSMPRENEKAAGVLRAERRFAWHLLWSYIAVFVSGALIYPAFRVRVRHELFDKAMPWCTGIFEIKEHLASFGLALAIAYYIVGKGLDPAEDGGRIKYFLLPAAITIGAIVLYLTAAGFYLTTVRSI